MVEPTSRNYCDSVETGYACLREESGHDVSDNTTDSVGCEDLWDAQSIEIFLYKDLVFSHIKGIVVASKELELCGKITDGASNKAKCHSSGWNEDSQLCDM
jgi:hypothetical protein